MKDVREKLGLSQEAVARELNISKTTVARWESQEGIPRLDNAAKLADMFGLTLETVCELFGVSLGHRQESPLALPGSDTLSVSRMAKLARNLNVSLKALYKAFDIDITGIPDDCPPPSCSGLPEEGA